MYQHQILQDISINVLEQIDNSKWFGIFKSLFLTIYIYKQSITDIESYYKTCTLISYKTSNCQSEIEKMPYYVFNNFITFLNEIVEEENKSDNKKSDSSPEDMMKNTQSMMSNQMSSMKGMLKR